MLAVESVGAAGLATGADGCDLIPVPLMFGSSNGALRT
jgi:hypothetical protein